MLESDQLTEFSKSVHGLRIRLTEERWTHICENHQLKKLKEQVLQTISHPDTVFASPPDVTPQFIAIKEFSELLNHNLATKMVVHYREFSEDGFIITAFTMSEKKLEKKVKNWFKVYPK